MLFYKDISNYYEKIFPLNTGTVKFLAKEFNHKKEILDLACGDGKYSFSILEPHRQVTGLDLDEGMLKEAEKKDSLDKGIKFLKGDMLDLGSLFSKEKFDGVFCIGNSLVHLTSPEKIKKVFDGLYSVMKHDGKLVIQIINYDRIINDNVDFLPPIKNGDIEFIRNYHRDTDSRIVDFHTILKTPKGDIESHQELYALKRDELIKFADNAGFKTENVYSAFNGKEWNDKSLQSIFVFQKLSL